VLASGNARFGKEVLGFWSGGAQLELELASGEEGERCGDDEVQRFVPIGVNRVDDVGRAEVDGPEVHVGIWVGGAIRVSRLPRDRGKVERGRWRRRRSGEAEGAEREREEQELESGDVPPACARR